VVVGRRGNAMRVVALDEKAASAGLSRGMGLSDARAIAPAIEVVEEDPLADMQLLEAIADWADRYTPLVALDPGPQADRSALAAASADFGLILDITGCANLFGGENAMLCDILSRLFHQGFAAGGAIAATSGAAHALARYRPPGAQQARQAPPVVAMDDTARAVAALPLAALRLEQETVCALARLGLRSVGQVMERPRAPLARRFGKALLLRLDQALGAVEEAISPRLPAPVRMAERRLATAVVSIEDVETLLRRLAANLCEAMEQRGEGARIIDLALFRVDGAVTRTGVGTSRPLRDPDAIARLFHERLAALHDDLDAGCGFDIVRLSVSACERFDPAEPSFAEASFDGAHEAVAGLADRLAARLGIRSVLRAVPRDTHIPEQAERLLPASEVPSQAAHPAQPAQSLPPLRPLRLFARPQAVEALAEVPDGPPLRFRWRRLLHDVVRAEGPERMAGQWWQGDAPARDYYRIEDSGGRRFWLFREGLHGEGDAPPRWFVHGLFA
jgi:protein ImuB